MRLTRPCIALLLGLTLSAKAQLDLRPHTLSEDGLVPRAYFADGKKIYAVTIDSETQLSEAENGTLFRFINVPQATMLVRPSPFANILPFDSKSLPVYLKAAKALLPGNSEDTILEAQTPDPLPINGWRSYRFVVTYTIANSQMQDSFTFLNLPGGQQILVQTSARLNFFKAISARADDIIRRWHEVSPDSENELN